MANLIMQLQLFFLQYILHLEIYIYIIDNKRMESYLVCCCCCYFCVFESAVCNKSIFLSYSIANITDNAQYSIAILIFVVLFFFLFCPIHVFPANTIILLYYSYRSLHIHCTQIFRL